MVSKTSMSMARKVVVVGDDKQVSPTAVGQDLATVQNLIKIHLGGIPNAHLYDGRTSVYDLAEAAFCRAICLTEHFRCVNDIIAFSNQISYNGRIKPLRDATRVQLRPHVIAHRVDARPAYGKVNRDEAAVVAALLIASTEHEAYDGKSFGVISLLGDDQALTIEQTLREHLKPEEYTRRRVLCGSAAQFQGDERDVMFLSVVHTAGDGPLRKIDDDDTKKRFNVAASRARDQMWVVHSLNSKVDLKPGDIRRRLIEHAEDPTAIDQQVENVLARTESEFERQVAERLIRTGYRVQPQWKVGSYRIDLVVEGASGRLAVECDGDRYHPEDQLAADMERQAILERLGWTFTRIRGSQFFRDPAGTMIPVFERLRALGIEPECAAEDARPVVGTNCEQKDWIIRRAYELLKEWSEGESEGLDETGDGGEGDDLLVFSGSNSTSAKSNGRALRR